MKSNYKVLSGKMLPGSPNFELYKNVYKLWFKTWKKAFNDVGSPEAFSPDDFYRQDLIPVIAYKTEPIAAHFYTMFHTENPAAMDHHYFDIFSDKTLNILKSNDSKRLMSLEYLTVNPFYRKSTIGFSLGEVISALGCKLLKEISYDAALGVAVKAAKVDKMALKLGFDILDNQAKRGNLVCDIVVKYSKTVHKNTHPDIIVNDFINYLWDNQTNSEQLLLKIAG